MREWLRLFLFIACKTENGENTGSAWWKSADSYPV